jgi:ssRNA-specific RNase YbeY (16S rRNA maturation enzyme)
MHEIGHIIGYDHSNEGTEEYGDDTGIMGKSYYLDEGPAMVR